MPVDLLLEERLSAGTDLSLERKEAIERELVYRNTLAAAARWLGVRPRTGTELAEWLDGRDVDAAIAARVDAKVRELSLLDEEEAAITRSRRMAAAGESAALARQKLLRAGITPELADRHIADVFGDDPGAVTLRAAQAQAGRGSRRLWGWLARRGHAPADIARAFRQLGIERETAQPTRAHDPELLAADVRRRYPDLADPRARAKAQAWLARRVGYAEASRVLAGITDRD